MLAEIEAGQFQWKRELEDVHMNVEKRLTEIVGPVGQKLHTGRSAATRCCWTSGWPSGQAAGGLVGGVEEIGGRAGREGRGAAERYCGLPTGHGRQPGPSSAGLRLDVQARFRARPGCAWRVQVSPLERGGPGRRRTTRSAVRGRAGGPPTSFRNSLDAVADRDFVMGALGQPWSWPT